MKIYAIRSPSIINLIGCLVFTTLGFIVLHLYYHDPKFFDIYPVYRFLSPYVAWLSIIFFGIMGVPAFTMAIIKPKTILEISDDGFYSKDWGYIEWENIHSIALRDIYGTKIIMFNTKNTLNKNKYRQKSNQSLTGYNFDITLLGTDLNIEEIEEIYRIMLKHVPNI